MARLLVGAALGACLVVFLVVAAFFLRDVALSSQTCTVLPVPGPAAPILYEACMARTQAAAGRLWWEIGALVIGGRAHWGGPGPLAAPRCRAAMTHDQMRQAILVAQSGG